MRKSIAIALIFVMLFQSISVLPPSYFSWVPNLSWLFHHEAVAQGYPVTIATTTQSSGLATEYSYEGRVYHINGYYWAIFEQSYLMYSSSPDSFTWSTPATLASTGYPYMVSTAVDRKNNMLFYCLAPGSGSTMTWANYTLSSSGTIVKSSVASETFTLTGVSEGNPNTECSIALSTTGVLYIAVDTNESTVDKYTHIEVWANSAPETTGNTWTKTLDVNTTVKSSFPPFLESLASGNMVLLYNNCASGYNATAGTWSSVTCYSTGNGISQYMQPAVIGNTVFIYYVKSGSGNYYNNYTLGVGWGTGKSLPGSMPLCNQNGGCVAASDNKSNIYVFGVTGTSLVYDLSTNGGVSYSGAYTLVSGLTSAVTPDVVQFFPDGIIPIIWEAGSASPYNIQFAATTTNTVTQPIKLTLNEAGYTPATFTISGCNPSPSTVVGDGAVHNITVNGLCTITISAPPNSTYSGYHFNAQSPLTCSSGTCTTLSYTYDRLFQIFAGSYPSSWGSVNFSTQWYVAGKSFGVSATPNAGYSFLAWYPTNGSISISSPASQSATVTATAGGVLYALYNYTSTTYPNVFSIDSLSPTYAYTAWLGDAWGFCDTAGGCTTSRFQQGYISIGQTILPGIAGYANWCTNANTSTTSIPGLKWGSNSTLVKYQIPFMIQEPLDGYDSECPGWAENVVTAHPDLITADYNGTKYNATVIGSSGANPVRFDSINFSYQIYRDLVNLKNNLLATDPTGKTLSLWVGIHVSSEGADLGDVLKPGVSGVCTSGKWLSCMEFSNQTLYDFYVSPQCQNYNTTLTCASMASAIKAGTYNTKTLASITGNYFDSWGASTSLGFGAFLDKSFLIALAYGVYNFTQQYNLGHPFVIISSYAYSNAFFSNTTYPYPFNSTSITKLDLLNRFVIPGKLYVENGNAPTASSVASDLGICRGAPFGSANNGVSSGTFPDGFSSSYMTQYMQNNEYYTPACIGSLLGPTLGSDVGNMSKGDFRILYYYGRVFNRLANVGHWMYPTPILSGTTSTTTNVTIVGGFHKPALLWFYTNSTTGDYATISISPASLGITGSWIAVSLLNWSVLASGSAGQPIKLTVKIPAQSWHPVYIIQTAPSGTLLYTNMRVISSLSGTNPQWVINGPHTMPIYMIVNSTTQPVAVKSNISGTIPQLTSLSAYNSSWVGWQWNGTAWNNMTQYGWYYDSTHHLVYILSQVGSPTQITLQTASLTSTTTSVSCSPTTIAVGSSTTCTATVTGSSPTGTVSFSSSSSGGAFNPTSCTLSSGSCSVSYSDSIAGSPTITATYSGDANNAGSSGSTTITVTSPPSGGGSGGGGGGGGGGIVQVCPPGQTFNYTSGQCSSPTLSTIQNNSQTQNNTLILLVIFVLLALAYMNRKKLRKYVR
jgi:hypothetical protein